MGSEPFKPGEKAEREAIRLLRGRGFTVFRPPVGSAATQETREAVSREDAIRRCAHPDCGRFEDGAGIGCRASVCAVLYHPELYLGPPIATPADFPTAADMPTAYVDPGRTFTSNSTGTPSTTPDPSRPTTDRIILTRERDHFLLETYWGPEHIKAVRWEQTPEGLAAFIAELLPSLVEGAAAEGEREAFERWYLDIFYPLDDGDMSRAPDGSYFDEEQVAAWAAWQAARAALPQAPGLTSEDERAEAKRLADELHQAHANYYGTGQYDAARLLLDAANCIDRLNGGKE